MDTPWLYANVKAGHGHNVSDEGDAHKQYCRWLPAVQNDWAARADWMVTSNYADANHQPV
jgi:hypothetical protein